MTAHTANFGLRLDASRAAGSPRAAFVPSSRAPVVTDTATDWLTRLAAWAERQPQHHRLGSWLLQR